MESAGLNDPTPQPVRPTPVPPTGGSGSPPTVTIPDHQLLRRIGAGSYGEVWLACHSMGMLRAVKIVYRASFQDQRPFERELSGIRKFEPISRSHEGFLDVLHVGINEAAGYFYYLMELGDDAVTGAHIDPANYAPRTLDGEIAQKGNLSLSQCLHLGLALSQALAELHRHDLVHRDIKPSNIIYVHGVPKLADIGLVAGVHEARSYVGTEGFIPPEGPGTPAADVFSLGKVLYEACTGKDRKDFPALPPWWDHSPEHAALLELNEVILQACHHEAPKRYRSARELHADLLLVENGKSVRRLRLLERRLAQLKRAAGIGALGLLVLGAVSFEVYQQWRRQSEARQRQVGEDFADGNREVEAGHYTAALPYFAEALELVAGNPSQEAAYRLRLGSTLAACPKLTHLWWLGGKIDNAQFSPDGQHLLVAQDNAQVSLYALQTGLRVGPAFGPKQGLSGASYSADGRLVLTSSRQGDVEIWDATTQERVLNLPHPQAVYCARLSSNGRHVVTACADGLARVWDVSSGHLERLLKAHPQAVRFATFSPHGQWIATASQDQTVQVWDAATGQPRHSPLPHPNAVSFAVFNLNGRKLATACDDHKVRLWDVDTGRLLRPEMPHGDRVRSLAFSPDGRWLATACWDGTVRLWSTESLQPVPENSVLQQGERVESVAFSPDGRCLVTGGLEGTVKVWDLAGATVLPTGSARWCSADGSRLLSPTPGRLQVWEAALGPERAPRLVVPEAESSAVSRNGRFLASVRAEAAPFATNHWLEVWDLNTGKRLGSGIQVPKTPTGLLLTDEGTRVAAYSGPTVRLWEVPTQQLLALLVHPEAISGAVFSPNARLLATRNGKELRVWNLESGRLQFPPLAYPARVSCLAFSPDGTLLAGGCADESLHRYYAQVWDANTGQAVGSRLQHGDGVLHVAFSPDSRQLVTASEDYTAAIWDARTGRPLTPALRHQDKVCCARFSTNGRWVVTASLDQSARVWNAKTGKPLTPPLRHRLPVWDAKFLADASGLFTRDQAGQGRLWALHPDPAPVEDLRQMARLLSGGEANSALRPAASQAETLEALWSNLQHKYPARFRTTPEEIAAWHEALAEECMHDKQWFAAALHLQQLLALTPNNPSLAARLAQAQENLKRTN